MKLTHIDISPPGVEKSISIDFSPQGNFILFPEVTPAQRIRQVLTTLLYGCSAGDSSGIIPIPSPAPRDFGSSCIRYTLEAGGAFEATGQKDSLQVKRETEEGTDASVLKGDNSGVIQVLREQLGMSGSQYESAALLEIGQVMCLKDFSQLLFRIRSIADTGTEDGAEKDPASALKETFEAIGAEDESGKPLQVISDDIRTLTGELAAFPGKRARYAAISSKITELEAKRQEFERRTGQIQKKIQEENLAGEIDAFKRIEELSHQSRQFEQTLAELRAQKEELTRRASEIRELTRDYMAYLEKPEQVMLTLQSFEKTLTEQESMHREKEQARDVILQKEMEILDEINKHAPSFKQFKTLEEFDLHMDEIESRLTKARQLNEKTVTMQEKEATLSRSRKTAHGDLGVGILLTIAAIVAVSTHVIPPEYRLFLLLGCGLPAIVAYVGFWQQQKKSGDLIPEITALKTDIQSMKAAIDAAKQELSIHMKELGVSTSTDVRIKFSEYDAARKDLESLHRVTEQFQTTRTATGEHSTLELEVRQILQNCAVIKPDEPLSSEILKAFREKFEEMLKLSVQQDKMRMEYRSVVDALEKEQDKKASIDGELKAYQTDFEHHDKSDQYRLLDYYMDLEELNLTLLDYREEIDELKTAISAMFDVRSTCAHLEEHLEYSREKQQELQILRASLLEAIKAIEQARQQFLVGEFVPGLRESTDKIIGYVKFKEEKSVITRLLERLGEPSRSAGEPADPQAYLSGAYLILKVALPLMIAKDGERLPLLFEDLGEAGEPAAYEAMLKTLLSLCDRTQIIHVTADRQRWDKIREACQSLKIACREEDFQDYRLMTTQTS